MVAAWLLAPGSEAHPGQTRTSRILQVDLASSPASFKYGFIFDLAGSEAVRKQADRDGDGAVSVTEGQAEVARWAEQLRRAVTVCRGAAPPAVQCAALAEVNAANVTGWESRPGKPLSFVWELPLGLQDTDRALEVRDSWRREEVQHTEAIVALPPEARLVSASPTGGTSVEGAVGFTWEADAAEGRRLALTWQQPRSAALIAAAFAGMSVAVTGALLLRARRRRASTTS
jgi:hypothetical protein